MAVVSGTVMAAKMLLKALAKKFTKKAIVKTVKKGIKKKVKSKVKSKIKDKLLGKKKDKRQAAKNIMQEQGEWSGGGAIVATAQPTSALIPSGGDKGGALATIDKEGGDKGPVDFNKMAQKLDNIAGMTGAISMMTKVEEKQAKDQNDARKIAKNKRDKEAREAKLESKGGGIGSSVKAGIVAKAKDPLAAAIKFFVNIALGGIVFGIINVIQNAKKIWEALKKGFLDFFWIIRAVLFKGFAFKGIGKGIQQLGKVIKGLGKLIVTPFEKAAGLLKTAFSKVGKGVSTFIGNIVKAPLKWAKSIIANAGKFLKNLPGVKQVGNLVGKVGGGIKNVAGKIGGGFKAAKSFVTGGIKNVAGKVGGAFQSGKTWAGNVAKKGLKSAKGFLGKGFKAAKGFLGFGAKAGKAAGKTGGKVGGKILKGGIGKIAKRGALKLLGKGAVKTIGKVFGRIPVIGPLMVALASMLSGDPPKQILFKALGAALGGLVGSFIPIPVLGTILGEMVGEFVGDLFYTLISGGGVDGVVEKVKKKAQQILQGGQAAAKWLGGGISRFIKNVLTTDAIDVKSGKPKGIRMALTKGTKIFGLYNFFKDLGMAEGKNGQIDKFPNLLNILNPIKYSSLMFKSFFPPSEEKAEVVAANMGGNSVDAGADAVAQDDPTQEGDETIIMETPSGGSGGSSGGGGGTKVLVLGSGDTLNSYYKAQVKQKLATV